MHKLVLKSFDFFRSFLQFLRALIMVIVMLLVLYWISNIASFNWSFLNFIKPTLDSLLALGSSFTSDSITIINAVFEFKYIAAIGILIIYYFLTYFAAKIIDISENIYCGGRDVVKKYEENKMNETLEKEAISSQKKLRKFQIFISLSPKKKFVQQVVDIDIKEQNNLMNKFLIEKLAVSPTVYKEGFLYSFSNIENIDYILDVFFKVINSKAPVNYIICVQVLGENSLKEQQQIDKMIDLNLINKIITMPDTIWRYKFNEKSKYETAHLGDYQDASGTFEVHEFKNDFGL